MWSREQQNYMVPRYQMVQAAEELNTSSVLMASLDPRGRSQTQCGAAWWFLLKGLPLVVAMAQNWRPHVFSSVNVVSTIREGKYSADVEFKVFGTEYHQPTWWRNMSTGRWGLIYCSNTCDTHITIIIIIYKLSCCCFSLFMWGFEFAQTILCGECPCWIWYATNTFETIEQKQLCQMTHFIWFLFNANGFRDVSFWNLSQT